MPKINKSFLISITLAGIVFLQNPPWFIWNNYYIYISFLVFILLGLCFKRKFKQPEYFYQNLPILTIIAAFSFFVIFSALNELRLSAIITVITYVCLFLVSEEEKVLALRIITKVLALIVFVSLSGWLINNHLFSLPMYDYISYDAGKGDDGYTILKNYFIFIEEGNAYINRFYSIFDEPGVLGTLSAFILFANRYNLRNKYNLIIFFGGLFTFSLAFIILTVFGVLFLNIKRLSVLIRRLIFLLTFIISVFLVFQDNETVQLLEERFSNLNERGMESRTTDRLNQFFTNYYQSTEFIWGKGTVFFSENKSLHQGQGYKIFMVEYGLLGLIIVFFLYVSLIRKKNLISYLCLALFFMSFLQRPFLFTPWQIILFSLIISNLNYNKQLLNSHD